MVLHLRGREMSPRDTAKRLIITTGTKRASTPNLPPSCGCCTSTTKKPPEGECVINPASRLVSEMRHRGHVAGFHRSLSERSVMHLSRPAPRSGCPVDAQAMIRHPTPDTRACTGHTGPRLLFARLWFFRELLVSDTSSGCIGGIQGEMLDPGQGPQGTGSHAATSSLILNYPTAMQFPAMPSPEKIVFTYDPDEFEKFVEEWVPALDSLYVRVVRQGGAGDHGIDVAAFLTRQGLEGSWHNYQCKRYKGTLAWSTAAGEIRKMFAGVVTGQFIVPEQYTFVAPSIGPSLQQALQRPVGTRKSFVEALRGSTDKVITDLGPRLRREAEELAAETPFEIFQTVNMKQMLEQHKTTEFWMKRFPPEFPPRPAVEEPPEEPEPREARYVQQLVQVYAERWPSDASTLPQIAQHPKAGPHLRHQREAFFSAESLRRFGEEAYPPGHFEAIVKDIYDAVIDVARDDHPTGWKRLQAVTSQAISAGLTQTVFAQHVRTLDRTGVCHHLAHENELTWCEGEGT